MVGRIYSIPTICSAGGMLGQYGIVIFVTVANDLKWAFMTKQMFVSAPNEQWSNIDPNIVTCQSQMCLRKDIV